MGNQLLRHTRVQQEPQFPPGGVLRTVDIWLQRILVQTAVQGHGLSQRRNAQRFQRRFEFQERFRRGGVQKFRRFVDGPAVLRRFDGFRQAGDLAVHTEEADSRRILRRILRAELRGGGAKLVLRGGQFQQDGFPVSDRRAQFQQDRVIHAGAGQPQRVEHRFAGGEVIETGGGHRAAVLCGVFL